MSDGSAWEREALSIKQVPSLQALLRCCDERLLVRAIVEEHAVLAGRSTKRARGAACCCRMSRSCCTRAAA